MCVCGERRKRKQKGNNESHDEDDGGMRRRPVVAPSHPIPSSIDGVAMRHWSSPHSPKYNLQGEPSFISS